MDQQGVTGVEGNMTSGYGRRLAPFQQVPGHVEPIPEAWQVYLPSPVGDLVLHLNAPPQHRVGSAYDAITAYRAGGTIIVIGPAPRRSGNNWPEYGLNRHGSADQRRAQRRRIQL
jgi:hypothetical protein